MTFKTHTPLATALIACGAVFFLAPPALSPRGAAWAADAALPEAPLTLDDCVRLAELAPSIAHVATRNQRIADYGAQGSIAGFFPRVRWNSDLTLNSKTTGMAAPTSSFVALNGTREYMSVIDVSMDIDISGRLRAGLARARADQAVAAAGAELAMRDLRRAVAAAYYRLLLARHIAESAQDALQEAQSFEARTRALLAGGEVAQADVARAALQTAILEQAVSTAGLETQSANYDLASFWTADVARPLPLADALTSAMPPPNAEAEPSAAGTNQPLYLRRPEVRIFSAQQRGLEADYRRLRADLLPQLSVKYQYGFDAATGDLRDAWRDRGQALFLALSVPIFDFFQTTSTYKPLALRAEVVGIERLVAERGLSRDYQTALARLSSLYRQIDITKRQTETASENLRLARLRYDGGEGSALEVVSAQTQLAQSRASYFSAQANYLNAHVELKVASGK